MKKFLVLFFASSLLLNASLLVKEKEINAGEVLEGETIIQQFILENRGSKPVSIIRVMATCGCTATEYDRTIPGGGSGKITLKVKTTGFQGPIVKGATVFTDDPDSPEIVLTIKAVVRPIVKIEPGKFIFVRKKSGERTITFIHLSSEIYPDFKILQISSYPENLKIDFERKANCWEVKITFLEDMKQGQNRGYLKILTDIENYRTLWINYLCQVEGD